MCKGFFHYIVNPDIELIAMALTLPNTYRQADTYLYTDTAPPPPANRPPQPTKAINFKAFHSCKLLEKKKKVA